MRRVMMVIVMSGVGYRVRGEIVEVSRGEQRQ